MSIRIEIYVNAIFPHVFFIYIFFFSQIASRIRYEITSGNIGGAFAVKNMTGAIYVAGALDYETRKRVSTSSDYFLFFILFFLDDKTFTLLFFEKKKYSLLARCC